MISKLIAICAISLCINSGAHAVDRNVDDDQDLPAAALSRVHQIAETFQWSSFKASEDDIAWNAVEQVVWKASNHIEMTWAGEQYRVLYDRKVENSHFPLTIYAFDGRTFRQLDDDRHGKKSMLINIAKPDVISDFGFWSIFGVYWLMDHEDESTHLKTLLNRGNMQVHAKWTQDRHSLEYEEHDDSLEERFVVRTDNCYLESMGGRVVNSFNTVKVTETQIITGKTVPKVIIRETHSPRGHQTTRYEFSDIRFLDPASFDSKGLGDLNPEVGTEVIDAEKNVAYRMTAHGPAYENLYNALTGKVTKGPPATQPISK